MSRAHAERFIKQVVQDSALRKSLYGYPDRSARMSYLQELGYRFEFTEFEEGYMNIKMDSPTQEQADMLDDLFRWWLMLNDG